MAAPAFEPRVDRTVRPDGNVSSFGLTAIPVAGVLVASIEIEGSAVSSDANLFRVELISVSQPVETLVFPDKSDFPPGKAPTEPEVVIEHKLVRRTEGPGPIEAFPGEDVLIRVRVENLTPDFVEAQGKLRVVAEGWDPIEISIRFSREGEVTCDVKQLGMQIRQGEFASAQVPVRWQGGPASIVFCSIFSRDEGTFESLPIKLSAPRTVIGVGQTADVHFTLEVGHECSLGLKRVRAFILGGNEAVTFDINLDVLPAPPPPPSNDIDLGGLYVLKRDGRNVLRLTGAKITPIVTLERVDIAAVSLPSEGMSEQQKDQIIRATENNVKEYFRINGSDSLSMPAAKAGAALYGAASAAAVAATLGPAAALPFVGPAAVKLGSNVGEFYGSIVDHFAAIIKGEDQASVSEVVGTMAVLFFTQISPIVAQADSIRFLGADGWTLTRELGKKVGAGLEAAIEGSGSVIGDIGDAIGDAVDFVGDLF